MTKPTAPIPLPAGASDEELARALAHAFGAYLRVCPPTEGRTATWWTYTGKHWQRGGRGPLFYTRRLCARYREMLVEERENASTVLLLMTCIAKLASSRGALDVIKYAEPLPLLQVNPAHFDANPDLLNVQNGTIDLRTGELRPHDHRDMCAHLATVEYQPDAVCLEWIETIRLAMSDNPEMAAYLKRVLGYSVTGHNREHKFWTLYGSKAGNGKSTIIEAIRNVLGTYAGVLRAEALTASSFGNSIGNDVAELLGKRFVSTQEVSGAKKFNVSLLKMLTGGDQAKGRMLYANNVEFNALLKLFLVSNEFPDVGSDDNGVWRRARALPFEFEFLKYTGCDPKVKDFLASTEARPGILNWLLEGAREWYAGGLQEPKLVTRTTEAHREAVSEVSRWIISDLTVGPESQDRDAPFDPSWIGRRDAHRAFRQWLADEAVGERPQAWPLQRFEAELQRLGYRLAEGWSETKNRLSGWRGLRSATAFAPDPVGQVDTF